MSKAYENTMFVLTLTGAVFNLLKTTFCKHSTFANEFLYVEVYSLHNDLKIIVNNYPKQDNKNTINKIMQRVNSKIRNNKYLQGDRINITILLSMVLAHMLDLSMKVTGDRKQKIDSIIHRIEIFNSIIEDQLADKKELEKDYEIGYKLYEAL